VRDESGFARYKPIRRTLIGAMALFPIPIILLLRDLWPTPAGSPSPDQMLSKTLWKKAERIVRTTPKPTSRCAPSTSRWAGWSPPLQPT
jgi:hypothetical protein